MNDFLYTAAIVFFLMWAGVFWEFLWLFGVQDRWCTNWRIVRSLLVNNLSKLIKLIARYVVFFDDNPKSRFFSFIIIFVLTDILIDKCLFIDVCAFIGWDHESDILKAFYYLKINDLGNFYVVNVTLGIALIAAVYAAESLYTKKEINEKDLATNSFYFGNKYNANRFTFDRTIKYSVFTTILTILLSVVCLLFNLSDQPPVISVAFSLIIISILYTGKIIMMSIDPKLKNSF
ncbi:hypothetical protein [Cobetia sp. 5-25-4-2]|uniref:hypothetical protein n=1 Tax=Cobetia sp. 5-25-4-2 TaxID=2737459 RepID=UPI001596957E|nr:hypothetical protein [Cobetia sp. 5-25-4-2]